MKLIRGRLDNHLKAPFGAQDQLVVRSPQNTPEMPDGLTQLPVEITNPKSEALGQLWGNPGGRYVPSVMYRPRSVVVERGAVQRVDPPARKPGHDVVPQVVS